MIDLIRQAKNRLLQPDILFQQNDERMREIVTNELSMIVEMCYGQGIYSVKCNEENNSPTVLDENKLIVDFHANPKLPEAKSFRLMVRPSSEEALQAEINVEAI